MEDTRLQTPDMDYFEHNAPTPGNVDQYLARIAAVDKKRLKRWTRKPEDCEISLRDYALRSSAKRAAKLRGQPYPTALASSSASTVSPLPSASPRSNVKREPRQTTPPSCETDGNVTGNQRIRKSCSYIAHREGSQKPARTCAIDVAVKQEPSADSSIEDSGHLSMPQLDVADDSNPNQQHGGRNKRKASDVPPYGEDRLAHQRRPGLPPDRRIPPNRNSSAGQSHAQKGREQSEEPVTIYTSGVVLSSAQLSQLAEASSDYDDDVPQMDGSYDRRKRKVPVAASKRTKAPEIAVPKDHIFKADPSKLRKTGKKVYYGVRAGRTPGIYYLWDEEGGHAKDQVTHWKNPVQKSFANAEDVEHFMNHKPEDCKRSYKTCWPVCQRHLLERDNTPTVPSHAQLSPPVTSPHSKTAAEKASPQNYDGQCDVCTIRLPNPMSTRCLPCLIDKRGLSEEQANVVRAIAHGDNVFYTGAAGTGKSTVLRATVEHLQDFGKSVEVIAFTGIAAYNAGGRTLHNYAGWTGKAQELGLDELKKKAFSAKTKRRLRATDVLIIDEISMVSNFTFARLDSVLKEIRNSPHNIDRPFGGVQLVVTGDFYQLPPVKPFSHCYECGKPMSIAKGGKAKAGASPTTLYTCPQHGAFQEAEKFAFSSKAWSACNFKCIHMNEIHRQSDPIFTGLLNRLRTGQGASAKDTALLMKHEQNVAEDAIKIFCLRDDVDSLNASKLQELQARNFRFQCVDGFHWERASHPELAGTFERVGDDDNGPLIALSKERHRYEEQVDMRLGMKVVLLANLNQAAGLVNGSQGRVIGFESSNVWPSVASDFTSNKSGRNRGNDQGFYQADQIARFMDRAKVANPQLKEGQGKDELWPIVRFENGHTCTIFPHCASTELGRHGPHSLISRTQMPLAAGWAVTAHKSQGMTLEQVVVDMDEAFEHGQAYVALSRARSLQGLKVVGLGQRGLGADEAVSGFMDRTFGPAMLAAEMEGEDFDDIDF